LDRDTTAARAISPARERILETAYELFMHRGFRAVGVDEIIAETGIAKATFYRHYPTKNALGLAFLALREQRWTRDFVESGARGGAANAEGQLLVIFDLFDEWFRQEDFEGCSFINMLLEVGRSHPLGEACVAYLANIRAFVEGLAREAELHDADEFAHAFHTLMRGSIIAAGEGDRDAARRIQPLARTLIDQHRPSRRAPRRRAISI